jgi:broad specificity phosphatase PhoE
MCYRDEGHVRHAQPDFTGLHQLDVSGWPVDIAPLDPSGEQQVMDQIPNILEFNPEIIISSPVTRALHTAIIVARLNIPLKVEFPLYDWLPDLRFQRLTIDELRSRSGEFNRYSGEWPLGEKRLWETVSMMRKRITSVLDKYKELKRVLVVCHQEPIHSVTGQKEVGLATLVPFNLVSPQDTAV